MLKWDEYLQLLNVNVPAAIFGTISEISEADNGWILLPCKLLSDVMNLMFQSTMFIGIMILYIHSLMFRLFTF